MVFFDNPAVGGANGVSKICFGLFWMIGGEDLIDIAALIFARFWDFPFVPDFDIALFEPTHVIGGGLINP